MKVYRIKHLPTGLYFIPTRTIKSKNGNLIKSNLSKKGKLYTMVPSLSWISAGYYSHLSLVKDRLGFDRSKFLPFDRREWVVEEVN